MFKTYFITLGITLIIAIIAALFWYQNTEARIGVINIYEGTVDITRSKENIEAKNDTPIFTSDILEVALNSRASITLEDGSIIRIEAGTKVKISELSFNLIRGHMWSNVKPLPEGESFEVETPTLVATVRGTAFDVSYINRQSRVYVYEGTVLASLISNWADIKKVESGFALEVSDDNTSRDFNVGPRPALPDEWIKFNLNLDKNIGPNEDQDEDIDIDNRKKNILPVLPLNIPASKPDIIAPRLDIPKEETKNSSEVIINEEAVKQTLIETEKPR